MTSLGSGIGICSSIIDHHPWWPVGVECRSHNCTTHWFQMSVPFICSRRFSPAGGIDTYEQKNATNRKPTPVYYLGHRLGPKTADEWTSDLACSLLSTPGRIHARIIHRIIYLGRQGGYTLQSPISTQQRGRGNASRINKFLDGVRQCL